MAADILSAAIGYARRGYEVLPVNGKVPLTRNGFKDATTDINLIEQWWAAWPFANVGCRPPEGVLICDVDPRNGGDLAVLGDYPRTRTAITGSGGWHVWFAATGSFRGALSGAPGVDIKTANSLVVMPPSVHPLTGERYRWLIGNPIAALPAHLVPQVAKPKPPQRNADGSRSSELTKRQLEGILNKMSDTKVERNNTLYWAACKLFEGGADAEAFARLEIAAGVTGLDDDEIVRTIASAGKKVGS